MTELTLKSSVAVGPSVGENVGADVGDDVDFIHADLQSGAAHVAEAVRLTLKHQVELPFFWML